ncbi:DUF6151 family protein [Shimia biformata]|uniref:DUF6151 family protein n=1 Tax=Shimia biformata TaxID=1294299 RepID=UPI00194EC638|nr:DUF6151 family protein [Shimia biformata]
MAGPDVGFSCRCGALQGVAHDVSPRSVNHLKCYCRDCQAAARHLGDLDSLDAHGATDLFQTVPSRIEITSGQEHLACLRLSPKGILRWYAGCCNSPLFTMLASRGVAFCGVNLARCGAEAQDIVGPVTGIYGADGARDMPEDFRNRGILPATLKIIGRSLKARVTGDPNPFFDAGGAPIVAPRILTLEERRAATPN